MEAASVDDGGGAVPEEAALVVAVDHHLGLALLNTVALDFVQIRPSIRPYYKRYGYKRYHSKRYCYKSYRLHKESITKGIDYKRYGSQKVPF